MKINFFTNRNNNIFSKQHKNNAKKSTTSFCGVNFEDISKYPAHLRGNPISIKHILFKNKLTGVISDAIAFFYKKVYGGEYVTVLSKGKEIASGEISPDFLRLSALYAKDSILRKNIPKLGDCIYIDYMTSNCRGAGTALHKVITKRSKDYGYNGRVALTSAWSAAPFHYTCGFRRIDNDGQLKRIPQIEQILEKYKETGLRADGFLGSYDMYLTENMAKNLFKQPL